MSLPGWRSYGGISWVGMSVLLLIAGQPPAEARAAFEIVSHSVEASEAERATTFRVSFNRRPDFFSVDEFGNPHDSFQYFYDSQPAEADLEGPDVVILRGPEIRFDNDIPVRDSLNPDGEDHPNAEGWGRKRGSAPFEMDGEASLTFTVPWTLLGETDEQFAYTLFALDRGELTTEVGFNSLSAEPIPLPGALGPGLVLLLIALGGTHAYKRLARAHDRAGARGSRHFFGSRALTRGRPLRVIHRRTWGRSTNA
jgi:hypothetical protein